MQDQVISSNGNRGRIILKRLSAIGLGLVAALLIASAILIFSYHQQSQTASQRQTQSTANQAPGTKVPGPAASEITIKQMGTVIQQTIPDGKKSTFTPTENYTFHAGQTISVVYAARPWQNTIGNNTLKWYQNDALYMQQSSGTTSPSIGSQNNSSMYTEGIVYNNSGSDKVEIYWGNQLAWTIYFTVQ